MEALGGVQGYNSNQRIRMGFSYASYNISITSTISRLGPFRYPELLVYSHLPNHEVGVRTLLPHTSTALGRIIH